MSRITLIAALSLATGSLTAGSLMVGLALPAPAAAQDAPGDDSGERVNQVIVYGNDPCPRSTSTSEITVCARKGEGERYRIPEPLRGIDKPESRAWTDKVTAYETVGQTGTLSCTPIGPGGYTGCAQKLINNAYAEKKNGTDLKFGDMIAAERAKRLSTIDKDAAEEQARVEQAEQDYEARRQANDPASPASGSAATPAAAPTAAPAPPGQ